MGWILEAGKWPARWWCGEWASWLGWLHIVSDVTIAVSYFALSVMALWFLKKSRITWGLRLLAILIIAFVGACGIGHAIEAVIFYYPVYRLAGISKAITASVSLTAAVVAALYVRRAAELPLEIVKKDAELLRVDAEIGRMVVATAHDLKSPVSSTIKYLELIQEQASGLSEQDHRVLEYAIEAQERAFSLVEGINHYYTAGRRAGKLEWVCPRAVAEEAWRDVSPPAKYVLDVHSGGGAEVLCSRGDVYRILLNLFSNSVRHAKVSRLRVTLSTEIKEDSVVWSVSDNGRGFDTSGVDVFEAFAKEGNGLHVASLGLPTVRKIVEVYGGEVSIESEIGKGTTIRMVFPRNSLT